MLEANWFQGKVIVIVEILFEIYFYDWYQNISMENTLKYFLRML